MDVLENAQNFAGLMSRVPGITVPLESNTPNNTKQKVSLEENFFDEEWAEVTKTQNVTTSDKDAIVEKKRNLYSGGSNKPVATKKPVVYNTYEDQKNSNVKLLQTSLNRIQTSTKPLVVDGLLGPNTYASLHAYQAQNNLTKRNWIDEETARLLNAANANTTAKKIAVNSFELNKLKTPQDRFDFIPSKNNYKHVKQIQKVLGTTDDGKWGSGTQALWSKYLTTKNINKKTFEEQIVEAIRVDPKTFEKADFYSFKQTKLNQDLITSMLNYAGIDESPNRNSIVHKVLRNAIGFDPSKEPWCAAVVAEVLKQSSYNIQNPGVFDLPGGSMEAPNPYETGSRYWQGAGKRILSTVFKNNKVVNSDTTETARPGDIIVLNKGNRTDPDASFKKNTKGHLGILIHKYPDGSVVVLGGNQRSPQNNTNGTLNVTVFTADHIQQYYPGGYVINRASGLDSVNPEIVSNLLNSFGKKIGGSTR